jgi:ribosomal protein L11 methyltransferase
MPEVLAVVLRVPVGEAELASDILWSLGVVAVEERPVEGDHEHVDLRTSLGDDPELVRSSLPPLPSSWMVRTEVVDTRVADTWREFAEPTWIDVDLIVVPAWVSPPSLPDGVIAVSIEPGATFGLGDHPTTRATLVAARRILRQNPGATVLDVGTGSGVLAVVAALDGATGAHGIDISPASPAVATANAVANGVADLTSFTTEPLADVSGPFDLVLANILAPTLVDLANDLGRVTKPGGHLVISGILSDRHEHVLEALADFDVERVDHLHGWVAVTLRRR